MILSCGACFASSMTTPMFWSEQDMIVPAFDAGRFRDEATDLFFRIQAAWANRDLLPVRDLLGAEVRKEFQMLIDTSAIGTTCSGSTCTNANASWVSRKPAS